MKRMYASAYRKGQPSLAGAAFMARRVDNVEHVGHVQCNVTKLSRDSHAACFMAAAS